MTTKTISTTYGVGYGFTGLDQTLSITAAGFIGGSGVYGLGLHNYTVVNAGTIETTPSAGFYDGVYLAEGGSVTNGSATDKTALIAGGGGVIMGYASAAPAGTVTNFGTILGTYYGVGIGLGSGGSVANGSTADTVALVEGYDGVRIFDKSSSLVNFGTIEATGKFGSGAGLFAGGTITNGSTSDQAALIEGGANGVSVASAPGSVNNFGTIEATGVASYETGFGIRFSDGGSVTNGGTADHAALVQGYDYGVYVDGLPGSVNNFGTIEATGTSANFDTYFEGGEAGVLLSQGGSVTNAAGGLIEGDRYGVNILHGAGTVVNSGTIERVPVYQRYDSAVQLDDGGFVSNSTGGVIAGGVNILGTGTVKNAGLINAGSASVGAGVFLPDGGIVINAGTIEGSIGINTFGNYYSSNAATVVNYGTIVGTGGEAVDFGASSDVLVVESHSKISGEAFGDFGTLELGGAHGAGTLTGLGVGTVSGSTNGTFSNFGAYVVASGASWTFTAGSTIAYGRELTVQSGGSLVDNGTINLISGRFIDYGALSGTGTIDIWAVGIADLVAAPTGVTFDFRAAGAVLEVDAASEAGVKAKDFALGDTIDISGLAFATGDAATYTGGHVELFNSGHTLVASIAATGTFAGIALGVASDGYGGTEIFAHESGTYSGTYTYLVFTPSEPTMTLAATGKVTGSGGYGVIGPYSGTDTFVNKGTVEVASYGFGVVLEGSGGSVTNAVGGVIEAVQIGVEISTGTVANSGTIEGTWTVFSVGINIESGLVTNSVGGLIEGAAFGVLGGFPGPVTIVNQGTIEASSTQSSDIAVFLEVGGAITNATGGLIEGGTAIVIHGPGGTIFNQGTIDITGDYNGGAGWGIDLVEGGAITNAAGGLIESAEADIIIRYGAGTVVNQGTIEPGRNNYFSFYAIDLNDGGLVSNSSGGQILGLVELGDGGQIKNAGLIDSSSSFGVRLWNGGIVVNAGTIEGAGDGIFLDGGGSTIVNQASGLVEGAQGISDYGIYYDFDSSPNIVVNYGTIDGTNGVAIAFFSSDDVLVVESHSKIVGEAFGDFGTLELGGGHGAGTLTGLGVGTLSGSTNGTFEDFRNYVVATGASWTFTALSDISSYRTLSVQSGASLINTGTIDLIGGTMIDDGALSGAGTINLYAGSRLDLVTAPSGGTIEFRAAEAVLEVDSASASAVKAANFAFGDTLDLSGIAFAVGDSATYTGGHVELFNSGHTLISSVAVTGTFSGASLGVASDGAGGTVIFEHRSGTYSGTYAGLQFNPAEPTITLTASGRVTGTGGAGVEAFGTLGSYTLVNFGTITSGSADEVIFKSGNGTVINEAGGLLDGFGIEAAMIANSGTIEGIGFDGLRLFAGETLTNLSGGLEFSPSNDGVFVNGGEVTNAGTILGGNLGIDLVFSGLIVNQAGGLIEGAQGVQFYYGSGTVENYGTIDGTAGIAVSFYESSGLLIVGAGSKFIGAVDGDFETRLEFGGGGGAGTLSGLFSGTLSGSVAGTFNGFSRYEIAAGANWTLKGTTTIASGKYLYDGGSLTNSGVLDLAGGRLDLAVASPSVFTNAAGAVLNIEDSSYISAYYSSSSSFVNAGTLEESSATAYSEIDVDFSDTGKVAIAAGDLAFGGQTSSFAGIVSGAGELDFNGGTVSINAGASISVATWEIYESVTVTFAESLTYAHTFTMFDGAVVTIGSGDKLILSGSAAFNFGTVNGAGILYISGSAEVAGLTVGGTVEFENTATVTSNFGMTLGDSSGGIAWIYNVSGATFDLTGDYGVALGGTGASYINNKGLFEKTGGIGTSLIAVDMIDYGKILVSKGTIAFGGASNSFAGAVTGTGRVAFVGGNSLFLSGATLSVAVVTLSGAATVLNFSESLSYAGILFSGANTISIASGDKLILSGTSSFTGTTVNGSGILYLSGPTTASGLFLTGAAELENTGTVTQSGNNLIVGQVSGDTNLFYNTATGIWDITDNTGIGSASSSAAINNKGLLEKTGGTGISKVTPGVTNSGTIEVTSGTLELHGSVGGTGSLIVGTSGTLQVDSGVAATETVSFAGTTGGELILNDPSGSHLSFQGVIAGFGGSDAIDLATFAYSTTATRLWTQTTSTQGTLTVTDGAKTATLTLNGTYTTGNFTLGQDPNGFIIITDPPASDTSGVTAPAHHADATAAAAASPFAGTPAAAPSSVDPGQPAASADATAAVLPSQGEVLAAFRAAPSAPGSHPGLLAPVPALGAGPLGHAVDHPWLAAAAGGLFPHDAAA